MSKMGVFAIDDDPVVLEALEAKLSQTNDMEFVGCAQTAQEGIEALDSVDADVVVMDVRMPKMSGTTAVELIKKAHPNLRVVLLTSYDDDGLLQDAMAAGADGLLLKGDGLQALISALRASTDGTMVISSRPLRRSYKPIVTPPNIKLTQREREVLALLCRACSNAEIAGTLFLSESRVKYHVSQLMDRFGVDSRLGLVVKAFEYRMVDEETGVISSGRVHS